MYKKVLSYIRDNKLINEGDKVLIALSGGPDSVCLLNLLFELKDELKIELGAAHLNHMLRGADAFSDEYYVKHICEQFNIPCFIKRVDINKYSKVQKLSSELAGREARYNFFDEIMNEHGFNKIATAHNANDQAETILFRLMRGTGLEGLGGIKVLREDKLIRPILCLSRLEVEKYIGDKDLSPRIDKTNFEKIYNRNKIRLDLLPYIKTNFNEDIVNTLNRMSVLLQKDNEFIENLASDYYKKYCTKDKSYLIIKKELFKEHEVIITRVLRRAVCEYSKSNYDFEMKHIYEIYNLTKNGTGKSVDLPNKIYAENIYGDIYIKYKKYENTNKLEKINFVKDNINNVETKFGSFNFKFSVIKIDDYKSIKTKTIEYSLVGYFDLDKINESISIKTRDNGDKMKPLGMDVNKKIKDIFINMKIPKDYRDKVPLLCFDDKIAWIIGVKLSEEYKLTSLSKNVLQVMCERKEY